MCTMEKALAELHAAGWISEEDALSKANHPQELRALLRPRQNLHLQGLVPEEAP